MWSSGAVNYFARLPLSTFLVPMLGFLLWAMPADARGIDHQAPVCLTATTDPATEALVAQAIETHQSTENEYFRIVLQYNVLRRSDGTGGFDQLELIDQHMRYLNWGFRDTPFVFVRVPGVRYIDDDTFYTLETVNEAQTMYLRHFKPGVGNIFMYDGQLFNNPNARAYTSHSTPARGHTYGDTRIGLPANIAYSPHELGHFLFLLHPYESSFAGIECVARSNCESAGDFVCDTPASPTVFGQNTLRTGEYFGTSLGPCVGDPQYQPLTDLWMEAGWQYGDPGALIRNRFTDGQVERMIATIHTISSDLVGPGRPDVLVDCDRDQVDDIDEILAGVEADIDQDKVPDQCQAFLRNGDLLVTGMNNADTNAPRYFDQQTGAFRGVLHTGAWWAHQVRMGPDGFLYMTSLNVILRLDPKTGFLVNNLVDGAADGANTFVDILFDANGDLLVLDNVRRDIKRYSRSTGAFLGQFAVTGLAAPKYMEYGPDNQIYVVGSGTGDDRVVRIDSKSGEVVDDFVIGGSGGLGAGQGLVFHSDGFLYVSNGSAGNVLRFDALSGTFDRAFVISANNGGLSNPHSLRFGPDGHLYVASRGTNSIKRFDGSSGAYIDDFVPAGSGGPPGTGTIDQPAGLLFAELDSASGGPEINPGMNGAWTNLETLGQGMFFDVIPEQQRIFLGWFTYETDVGIDLAPDANAHRWMVAIGPYEGNRASMELLAVSGGTFNGPDAVTETTVGTATLQFSSCTEAEFAYELDAGPSGSIALNRLLPDVLCEGLAGGELEGAEDFSVNAGLSGSWANAEIPGQGLFGDVDSNNGDAFFSWFTFGYPGSSAGSIIGFPENRWFVALGAYNAGDTSVTLDIIETEGGIFDDPETVSEETVGSMTLEFLNCAEASMSFVLDSGEQGQMDLARLTSTEVCHGLTSSD